MRYEVKREERRVKKQRSTLVNSNADLFYCNKKGRPKMSVALR